MDLNILKNMKLNSGYKDVQEDDQANYSNDIAIIGLDAKIAGANSVEEFWEYLCSGRDMIREFPQERVEDANNICLLRTDRELSSKILPYGYLDRIDLFDPDVFGISNMEAELMDPAQRIFLQSAWTALEDAGYGGKQLKDSMTGVYIGMNNINNQYCATMDEGFDASTYGLAVSGNVNSITASRISYHLNLKGPAVVFDTACSSSLVAVYFACQQLRTGEVSTAIAGGIRIGIIPPQESEQNFGIESASARTKSFDAKADGTGGGEGVVAMVLKPLKDARKNKDHIYAIIKGGSINQDGTSVGITAPNASAQESVIKKAWKNACIDPETISYIEAHATATKLGDPIEISGIEKAFRSYTTKRQFCAIGSVKSNTGHLDSAAGIAGLLKTVLMLKYKMIPPSLHFREPNPQINFIESPVYVNDTCIKWELNDKVRRAGVSSFGISGTNCHMVLEEDKGYKPVEKFSDYPYVLTVSAKNKETVIKYLKNYIEFLENYPDCDFHDFCYTANACRQHYNSRFVIILKNKEELFHINLNNLNENGGRFHEFKVIETENNKEGYISIHRQSELTKLSTQILNNLNSSYGIDKNAYTISLYEVCDLYMQGADIDWEQLYEYGTYYKMSIPTYPYNNKRLWHTVIPKKEGKKTAIKRLELHPLIDCCVTDSYNLKVFEKVMSPEKCWELREHMINGEPVLPGTAFLEMAAVAGRQIYKFKNIEFQNLQYINPMYCPLGEQRLVHIIVHMENDESLIKIVSKDKSEEWLSHLEVTVKENIHKAETSINIKEKLTGLEEVTDASQLQKVEIATVNGSHWNNLEKMYVGKEDIVLLLNVDNMNHDEKDQYYLYPPVLDSAVNAGTYIVDGEYLPFSFSNAKVYEKLPNEFYSFIHKKKSISGKKIISFDIILCTRDGKIIAEFNDYMIRLVENSANFIANLKLQKNMFHSTEWIPYERNKSKTKSLVKKYVAVIYRKNQDITAFKSAFAESNLIFIKLGDSFIKESETSYELRNESEDFEQLICGIRKFEITAILQYTGYDSVNPSDFTRLKEESFLLLKSTMTLLKVLVKNEYKSKIMLAIITKNGTKVLEEDKELLPMNKALIGMGTCIENEYSNIKVRSVDLDEYTSMEMLYKELEQEEDRYLVAYRKNERYIERIKDLLYSEKINQKEYLLKSDGVYVIAGGLGGMGIAITKHILELEPKANVVLLNRTYTEKEFRDSKLREDKLWNHKREVIFKLWADKRQVEIMKADISDYNELDMTFSMLRSKYNKINGVINAAGIAGEGFLMNKDWSTFESVLNPKIYGTWNLNQVTMKDDLQFFVLCSSLTSIFGAPGQSDYAAANAYMDCFSYYREQFGGKSLTLNWTGWSESGMAVQNTKTVPKTYVKFLSDAEGSLAFMYALKTGEKRLLIGEFNMEEFQQDVLKLNDKIVISDVKNQNGGVEVSNDSNVYEIENILVSGKNVEELTDTEKNVVVAWAKILSTKDVDVYDKFFEIGGNSLLALNLQKELNKNLAVDLAITDIFVHSTILELSNYITSMVDKEKKKYSNPQVGHDTEDELEALLDQFMNGEIDEEHLVNS